MSDIYDDLLRERGITTRPAGYEYENPDRWMTKDEAVVWLNVWRETAIPKYNLSFPTSFRTHYITSGIENVYLNGLIDELIRRVKESPNDPITTVAEYNYEMDNILAMSDRDHEITHKFAGFMERSSYEVLLYLKDKEKELNGK